MGVKLPKISVKKIPGLNIPDAPIVTSSQDHMPIADIIDDIVLYKDGGAAIVMESSSLNFGLLSVREQEAVVAAFAALINSLGFSIQFLVRTQIKDITSYLKYVDEAMAKLTNPKLKVLMQGYKDFISETITKRNVLGKRFFIILPFSSLELGVTQSFASFVKKKGPLPFTQDYVLKKVKVVLYPRMEHITRQAARLGLQIEQLDKVELVKLYYDVYNPNIDTVKLKGVEE